MAMALPMTRLDVAKEKPLVSVNVNTMMKNSGGVRTFQCGGFLHRCLMFKQHHLYLFSPKYNASVVSFITLSIAQNVWHNPGQ